MFDFEFILNDIPSSPCMMFSNDGRWEDEKWVNEQSELSAADDSYEKGKEIG